MSKNPQSDFNKEVSSDVPLKGLVEMPEGRMGDKAGLTKSLELPLYPFQPSLVSPLDQCSVRIEESSINTFIHLS